MDCWVGGLLVLNSKKAENALLYANIEEVILYFLHRIVQFLFI